MGIRRRRRPASAGSSATAPTGSATRPSGLATFRCHSKLLLTLERIESIDRRFLRVELGFRGKAARFRLDLLAGATLATFEKWWREAGFGESSILATQKLAPRAYLLLVDGSVLDKKHGHIWRAAPPKLLSKAVTSIRGGERVKPRHDLQFDDRDRAWRGHRL